MKTKIILLASFASAFAAVAQTNTNAISFPDGAGDTSPYAPLWWAGVGFGFAWGGVAFTFRFMRNITSQRGEM